MESLERKLALREQAGMYGGLAGRIAGLSRAGQIVRSTVPVDGDDVPIIDSIEKVDDMAGRVNDAVEEVDSALENAYEAAQEALEAKQKALEALADAIAALEGIEDLEADLTPQIVAAQAVADQAAQDALDAAQASADADAKAVQAAQDAATAAGIANGKGKTIIQSATPDAADQLAQNLWIDTTGGNNTPKRWSGSAWVAVTDKVAVDAAAAAVAAQLAADASRLLAEGLYQVIPSTTAPTTSPTGALKQGDQWWKIGTGATAGQFVGVAVWNGSAWQDRQLVADSVLVPGSAGSVVIKDGAVTAPKITASEALSAKVAEFIQVKASQLVADSAAMNAAFIGQLVGEKAFFDAMLTGRLIVAGSNLIPWTINNIPWGPYGSGATITGRTDNTRGEFVTLEKGNGTDGTLAVTASLTQGMTGGKVPEAIQVGGGESYTARIEVGLSDAAGAVPSGANNRRARIRVAQYDATGTFIAGTTKYGNTLTNLGYGRGQWSEIQITTHADARGIRVWIEKAFWSSGSLAVMTAEVMKSVGAVLIEDGAITAPKLHVDALNFKTAVGLDLTSGTVTGATIRTAASGQRLQLDVNGLRAFDSAGQETATLVSGYGAMQLRYGSLVVGDVNPTYPSAQLSAQQLDLVAPRGSSPTQNTTFYADGISTNFGFTITAESFGLQGDTNWANISVSGATAGFVRWRRYLGRTYLRFDLTLGTAIANGASATVFNVPAAAGHPEFLTPVAVTGVGITGYAGTISTGGTVTIANSSGAGRTRFYGAADWEAV